MLSVFSEKAPIYESQPAWHLICYTGYSIVPVHGVETTNAGHIFGMASVYVGAVDAPVAGHAGVLFYFKCPVTPRMLLPCERLYPIIKSNPGNNRWNYEGEKSCNAKFPRYS
jgi:hypothetical protein